MRINFNKFDFKIFNYSKAENETIRHDITLGCHVKMIKLDSYTDEKLYNKIANLIQIKIQKLVSFELFYVQNKPN